MPLGKYQDFDSCVQGHIQQGHSEESAKRICGAMQQRIEGGGSSYVSHNSANNIMSEQFPPKQDKPAEEDGNGNKVELSAEEAGVIAQYVVDSYDLLLNSDAPEEVKTEGTKALDIIQKTFQVEEEPKPPA